MRRPSRPLHPGDARRLYDAAPNPQARALIALLWRAGLRTAEACALERDDVTALEAGGRLHVCHGKGGRSRYVGLDAASFAPVAAVALQLATPGPLFRTRTGSPWHPSHVRRLIPRLARIARITGRVHPHALRHTYARELHDEGFSVREIQVLLGHSTLATTQTYLASIGCEEAVTAACSRVL